MNTTIAQFRLLPPELTPMDWAGLAILVVALLAALYAFVVIVPKMLSLERTTAGRIVELLESIDRRLAERDGPRQPPSPPSA